MTWSLPGKPMSSAHGGVRSFCKERLMWHSYLSEEGDKEMTRMHSPEY